MNRGRHLEQFTDKTAEVKRRSQNDRRSKIPFSEIVGQSAALRQTLKEGRDRGAHRLDRSHHR